MRITCGACNAQYNLPDERVRGRRVKVRCKRCSEGIIVDGTALDDDFEDEATRVMDAPIGQERMWTVNLSEEEQGDMTDEELIAAWRAGVVTEDAYVWKEGMEDWEALLDVPEIAAMLEGVPRPAAAPEAPPAEGPSAPVGLDFGQEAIPSPIAEAPPPDAPPPEPHPLESQAASAPALATPRPLEPTAPAAGSGSQQYKGLFDPAPARREPPKHAASRDENSVLFSLDALKAAATSDAPKPASAGLPSGRISEELLTLGGPTLGELNAAPLIQVEQAPPPMTASPTPVAVQSSLPPPAASTAPPPPRSPLGMIAAVVVGAVLAGGGVLAGQKLLGGSDEQAALQPQPTAATTEPTAASASATSAATQPSAPSASAVAAASAPAVAKDTPAKTGDTRKSDDKPDESSGHASHKHGSSSDSKSGSSHSKSGSGSSSSDSKSGSSSSSSDSSHSNENKEPQGTRDVAAADVKLEEDNAAGQFSTSAAKAALSSAAVQAQSCASKGGPTGKGKVQVTFVPSGRVTSANVVSGPFGGTTVGGCVARKFRAAKVPKFQGAPVTVAKSFTIK
jgi:predicted Zn finger-like uncharacterized protein